MLTKFLQTAQLQRRCKSVAAAHECLSGVKVVDLTRILAGPFCTMLLSDLGAEVIKVERPGTGDETRQWGPPFLNGVACYFLTVNRNKKSIAVDLKQPAGVQIVKDLVAQSDVFVENYIPGKLDEMGLGYSELTKLNPGIVYCSISGFGNTGPYATRPGFDVIAASMGGLLSITGPEDGPPCKVGVAITDLTTGLYAKGAILAALYQKEKTGLGRKIDCNLLSTQVSVLANLGVNYLNTGAIAGRRGTAHETVVPYQSFECSDGVWITIGAGSNVMFAKLCKLLFTEEEATKMMKDSRFLTNADRAVNRTVLIDILSGQFKTKASPVWLKLFETSGIPCGRVNNVGEVFDDPQVLYSESVVEATHPTAGQIKLLGPAVKYGTDDGPYTKRQQMNPPPLLGQHSEYVLRHILNYNEKMVQTLKESKVVECA